MLELVRAQPRFGYRRIWVLLRREGWRVNRKRVWRLWRQQGLKVPRKKRKKRRLGHSGNSCVRRRARYKNHVWAWDFIYDRTADGRPLKWLTLVDEFTRECLALEVARGMTAKAAAAVVARVIAERGAPGHLRSDNGSEMIARAMQAMLAAVGVETLYIEPGAPWENGYAESFNSKLRDEFLNAELFDNAKHAQAMAAAWKWAYNEDRPHSSLNYLTPAEFSRTLESSGLQVAAAPLPCARRPPTSHPCGEPELS